MGLCLWQWLSLTILEGGLKKFWFSTSQTVPTYWYVQRTLSDTKTDKMLNSLTNNELGLFTEIHAWSFLPIPMPKIVYMLINPLLEEVSGSTNGINWLHQHLETLQEQETRVKLQLGTKIMNCKICMFNIVNKTNHISNSFKKKQY